MKIFSFISILLPFLSLAQRPMSMEQILPKVDSIQEEADLIFAYEKAAQTCLDSVKKNENLNKAFEDYLVYPDSNKLKCIAIDQQNQSIYELLFSMDSLKTITQRLVHRNLSEGELRQLNARQVVLEEIQDSKYGIENPEATVFHEVLLPYASGYKFYYLTGTTDPNIRPFGNDFLFYTDKEGKITRWREFHKKYLPIEKVNSKGIANHWFSLQYHISEPFIFASDIFIFRWYDALCCLDEFSIHSNRNKRYFTYNKIENKVRVEFSPSIK